MLAIPAAPQQVDVRYTWHSPESCPLHALLPLHNLLHATPA